MNHRLKSPSAVGQKVEPTTCFGEAEILGPLIPRTGLVYVGLDTTGAKAGEDRRIIGGAHRQGGNGVAGFGGALKDDAGGDEIAGRGEFLTLLDQHSSSSAAASMWAAAAARSP